MQVGVIVFAGFLYLAALFGVASYGDRLAWLKNKAPRPFIYALSLAVYCTSWTFFGSVGLASREGYSFINIYIGAGIMFSFALPIVLMITRIAKGQNTTSVADFISARYGKSTAVAVVVTLVALLGALPYISLQLKAISESLLVLLNHGKDAPVSTGFSIFGDISFLVALTLVGFAMLFGTRHVDATENQRGLMLAIATESVVKLATFLLVGAYITFFMFDGFGDIEKKVVERGIKLPTETDTPGSLWLAMSTLSFFCALLLPRQFHVAIVENNSPREIFTAIWMFPLYLVLINLFVIPVAMAGLAVFGTENVNADMFVLLLPYHFGSGFMTALAFIGGLSAATAMVIVSSVALSIMVCNEIIVPLLLRNQSLDTYGRDLSQVLLVIRRVIILIFILLAYIYYRIIGAQFGLAFTGLLSFVAIAQLAPAMFIGLFWKRGTAFGAVAGMAAGIAIWAYTMLLPILGAVGMIDAHVLTEGPFGLTFLKPDRLFYSNMPSLANATFWSLSFNILFYFIFSLLRSTTAIERAQAHAFVHRIPSPNFTLLRRSGTAVTVDHLINTVSRYLGAERTRRAFNSFAAERGTALEGSKEADLNVLRFAEHQLASAIGNASSRLVLSLLLSRHHPNSRSVVRLLDDASEAIIYNRDLMQLAIEHVHQGIAVFSQAMTLSCWNQRFRKLLDLPDNFGQVGTPLMSIVEHCARRGDCGNGPVNRLIDQMFVDMTDCSHPVRLSVNSSGAIIEIVSRRLPDGGLVATFSDISVQARAAQAMQETNELLEQRVAARTEELTQLNEQLVSANAQAEAANRGKTKFLAAAGHDLVQPLNAARLYNASLMKKCTEESDARLVHGIDLSLRSIEEIIEALMEISKLDAGALVPDIKSVELRTLFEHLRVEFEPVCAEKGLKLRVVDSSLWVRSDRAMLRRLLVNLVSNAVKYTKSGRVLVGVRRRNRTARIEVWDSGIGIPKHVQGDIFQEFFRLDSGIRIARGLGLGLSIVQRIAAVLKHPVHLQSIEGKGTVFMIQAHISASLPTVERHEKQQHVRTDNLEKLVVLCVDNEQQVLDAMQVLLSMWGCEVHLGLTLEQAQASLIKAKKVPDILLIDYQLDEITGVEVIVEARWKYGNDLPAVIITADRTPGMRQKLQQKHILLLRKPVKPSSLRAILTSVAQGRPESQG